MTRRKRYTRNLGRTLRSPSPVRTTVEWIRFEHEHEPYGVFSYVGDAREILTYQECAELDVLLPDLLTIGRFWFRAEAAGHIAQARRMAALLTQAAIPIVERRTRRIPGKVKWEDDDQVAWQRPQLRAFDR